MVSILQFSTSRNTHRATSSDGAGIAQITNNPTPGSDGAGVVALADRPEVAVVGAAVQTHPLDRRDGSNCMTNTTSNSLRRTASDASDANNMDHPAKHAARTLLSTMKTLKDNIVAAMNGNQWREIHALQTNNVKFLLGELAEVLTDMQTYQPGAEVAVL